MRDIKSNKKPNQDTDPIPEDIPEDAKKLYEKHKPAQKSKPRFTGSKVPVASVHVPRQQSVPKRTPNVVHTSTEPAQMERRPLFAKPKQKEAKQPMRLGNRERRAVGILGILALLALAMAGFVFLPKANIELVLQTAPLLVDQQFTLASQSGAAANVIPATAFQKEVAVTGSTPVTSTQTVGEKATGQVTLVNKTTQEQPIKEQSRLVTKDGVLFYMTKHAILAPDSTATVPVEAAEPGEEGNVSSGRLTFAALDDSAATILYAEVNAPITGGSGDEVKVVQEEDLQQAQDAADAAARQKVEEEIRASLKKGWVVLEESWTTEGKDFTVDAAVGDQVDTIGYTGTLAVRVMGYEEEELQNQLRGALEERLDENYMLFPGPISFTKSVGDINWEDQKGAMTVRVTHTTVPNFSLDTLKSKLSGRSEEEAEGYLRGLKGVQSASIDLWPFWVRTVPRIDQRIELDISSNQDI